MTLLLTQREAALALRCSERTLERWRVLDPQYMERLRELDERVMNEGIHPYWRILRALKEWMWGRAWAEAKEEMARKHPDWVRQWPELFR